MTSNTIDTKKAGGAISVSALKAGDRNEFARLVDEYSGQIYRLALRILDDAQDAEDVLQETFIKAINSISGFEERSSLSTWLYRIATNEALMLIRKRKPNVSLDDEPDEDTPGEEVNFKILDWCCLPENELLSKETRQYLKRAIKELSPNLRIVFVLRDMQGLSVRDTAEALGLTEVAVKTRLLRARLQLRELITRYFGERSGEKKSDE
ncbi:MAG: sigma-70 family RNA polymerase sigma factor [Chloroflexi bacterium]|jgi:RNA polymerase sigma-70 factor (ECF subfamily)|nr:sigma-70 family RNA polymerase sigma factor [Chloroflexota bacterium]